MKRLRLLCVVLLIVMASLLGCGSNRNPFEKGAQLEQNISVDKVHQIGQIEKTGWAVTVPQNTFDETITLSMSVVSRTDSKVYESSEFTLLGTPLELKVTGKENVRLNQPVKVTIQIPSQLVKDLAKEELFYGYYYDGKWEYFVPDNIDLEKGTATFDIHHFSRIGFGRPSEQKQIETFAKDIATRQWEIEAAKQEYLSATSTQFDALFSQMGVKTKAARNKLMADIVSYVDPSGVGYFDFIAQSTLSLSQGKDGNLAFENKMKEFVGKALLDVARRDPSTLSSKVNVIGNLASAAGAIAGGDNKAALEHIANMLNGAVPLSQLAASTSAYVKAKAAEAIEYWTRNEIEKAYQVYKTGSGGKWGYSNDVLKGDFDTIFTLLGGGQRQMDIKIIQQYCEARGKKESDLSQADRARIIASAREALKNNFDKRILADQEIEKRKLWEESFIEELKKQGLLSAYTNQGYFGIDKRGANFDINVRLSRLYAIKASVLNMMDADQTAKIQDEFLVKAIARWIDCSEKKDIDSFYKYMRDMGYIKEALPTTAEYAWVLVETKTNDWQTKLEAKNENSAWGHYGISASTGSATFTYTYTGPDGGTYGDSWIRKGMSESGQMTWTEPSLQTIKPNEKFSLLLTCNHLQSTFKYPGSNWMVLAQVFKLNTEGNQAGSASYLVDENGKSSFTSGPGNNHQSFSSTVYGSTGGGTREGERMTIRVSASNGGVNVESWYIYEWRTQ